MSYLENLTLSFLRVKTPAKDINDDMEKGEMVIEDREQLTTKRESSQNLSDLSLFKKGPPKI